MANASFNLRAEIFQACHRFPDRGRRKTGRTRVDGRM